jgi:two-component system phosphate regulon sensor histidine kinase PhoR
MVGGKDMHCMFSCNTIELDTGIALSIIITDLSCFKRTPNKQLQISNEQLEESRANTAEAKQ